MTFIIFVICYLLLPHVHSTINLASSYITISPLETTFQPANPLELLSTTITTSFFSCALACNTNIQCRTFVYDIIIKSCTQYEGETSTGTVLSNSTTTQIGSIKYSNDLYRCYNKTNEQCSFDRYLVVDNVLNVGICPINTYWNGSLCLNQVYYDTTCNIDEMCRSDIALGCGVTINDTCSGGYDVNLVRNGDAETGPCGQYNGGPMPAYWTFNGSITQLYYNDTDGAMDMTAPGPSNRGNCYFWGGPSAYSYMYQTIKLKKYSSRIDENKVSYNFTTWVGGWGNQDDVASLWLNFYNSNNNIILNVTIPAVYASDRMSITQLLYRERTGIVPVNARSARIYVGMTSSSYNNDGSVDSISFKLRRMP